MNWLSGAPVLGLGLIFGLKHALDADHVAAVAAMVGQSRSLRRASFVGMLWGVGHTVALLAVGVAVILLHAEIGSRLAAAFELGVALMLIGLGANTLRTLARGGTLPLRGPRHGGRTHPRQHRHHAAAAGAARTRHGVPLGVRPLVVGVVHGLAGSAALMLLVLSTIPSALLGIAYIGVFGLGSIGGMMLMSLLVSLPLRLSAAHSARADIAMRSIAGCVSLGWGLRMVCALT